MPPHEPPDGTAPDADESDVAEIPRETRVLAAVVALVDSLLADFDVVELLTELTEHCAQLLDVASAGLLLADPRDQLHLMAATSDRTHDLELFQLQREEGPCLDCFAQGRPVSVADLRVEADRWPAFVQAATDAGFRSVHALPMRAGGTVLGTLGLFGTTIGELNASDLTVGQALAHVASVAILDASGATIASATVTDNLFVGGARPAGGATVEALDADGSVISTRPLPG